MDVDGDVGDAPAAPAALPRVRGARIVGPASMFMVVASKRGLWRQCARWAPAADVQADDAAGDAEAGGERCVAIAFGRWHLAAPLNDPLVDSEMKAAFVN